MHCDLLISAVCYDDVRDRQSLFGTVDDNFVNLYQRALLFRRVRFFYDISGEEIPVINKSCGFMTKALHSGWECDPATGASGLPIYATSAYQFKDSAQAAALFNLEEDGFIYSRLANPTVKAFEDTLNSLEGGASAIALASGQAAFAHLIAALCSAGSNLVISHRSPPSRTYSVR